MWQKIKHLFKQKSEADFFRKYDEALVIIEELAYGYQSRKQYNIMISKARQYLYKYNTCKYKTTKEQTPDNEVQIGNVYKMPYGVAIVIGKRVQWNTITQKIYRDCHLMYYDEEQPHLITENEETLLAQPCYGTVPVYDFFWQAKKMVFDKIGWLSHDEEERL